MDTQPFLLNERLAVITGGSSGIGLSIAEVFVAAGAQVCILDIQPTPSSLEGLTYYHCDIRNRPEVTAIFDKIIDTFGKIDILVNNAGKGHIGTIETTTEEDLNELIAVNIKGVFHCTQCAVTQMKKQQSGVLLNLASVASVVGLPERFGYSMTKGAVLNMTYTVARDVIQYGIRCNAIGPARVHTPFVDQYLRKFYPGQESEMMETLSKTQPIGRMATPMEIAYLARYLASDEASFITGSFFPIDGGFIRLNT